MKALFRIGATTVAVLGALNLSACKSDGSVFSGATVNNSKSVFNPKKPNSNDAKKPVVPNQDSKAFTSSANLPAQPAKNEPVEKNYYTAKTRTELNAKLEELLDKRLNTTFKYTALLAKDGSAVTTRYLNGQVMDLTKLGNGYQTYTMQETLEAYADGKNHTGIRESRLQLYQQPNSIVLGKQTLGGNVTDGDKNIAISATPLRIDQIKGNPYVVPTVAEVENFYKLMTDARGVLAEANKAIAEAQKELADTKNKKNEKGEKDEEAEKAAQAKVEEAQKSLQELQANVKNAAEKYRTTKAKRDIFDGITIKKDANGVDKYAPIVFDYKGKAFNQDSQGNLEYQINFNTKTGQGIITDLDIGKIDLNVGNMSAISHKNPDDGLTDSAGQAIKNDLSMLGVTGVAKFADGRDDGTYHVGIFGENAEEIAGIVSQDNVNIVGFGGTKQ